MTRGYLETCCRGGSATGKPGWLIEFEYDQVIVEDLKAIPAYGREWNPTEKRWWVSSVFEDRLESIFPNFHAFRNQKPLLSEPKAGRLF